MEYDHIQNCTGNAYHGREETAQAMREYIKQMSMERAMGMTPDMSTWNKDKSTKFLTNVKNVKENKYEGTLSVFSSSKISFRHQGDLDDNGKFKGYTVLNIINDCQDIIENTNKNSSGVNVCPYPTFTRITGFFKGGLLDGPVYMFTKHNQ